MGANGIAKNVNYVTVSPKSRTGNNKVMEADIYPMVGYRRSISLLMYPAAWYRRFISLLVYPTTVYVH